jgi:hypothetical protein
LKVEGEERAADSLQLTVRAGREEKSRFLASLGMTICLFSLDTRIRAMPRPEGAMNRAPTGLSGGMGLVMGAVACVGQEVRGEVEDAF